ncbi:hypothetical protein MBLNU230_g2751t1 [Neophaeotheca triangularis]
MAEKEHKKRKRQSNGVEPPNKKSASDGSIQVIQGESKGLHPVLVSTPGLTTPSVPFKAYAKSRTGEIDSKKDPRPATHHVILHSAKHPRLDYAAKPPALDEHLSHYTAVFDPANNTLQVVPAHHLSLRSTLRSEAQEVEAAKQNRSYAQQREQLGMEFGTKKAKKAIASKTENAISRDTKGKGKKDAVQSAILDTVGNAAAAAPSKEAVDASLLASKPIPKPNLEAETVEEVYSLRTLIPPHDLRQIPVKDWQDAVASGTEVILAYRYPASHLTPVTQSEDISRLKALRYLDLLLHFHGALAKAGRAGHKVPKKDVLAEKLPADQFPPEVVDSVRKRFSNENNELSKWHMDNLYTHICALSLFIDGWTTNTTNLKEDLRFENRQIAQYFNELGCKVSAPTESEREKLKLSKSAANATRIAKLKLPLDFPKPRAGRRK